jgi:hypothetical protein
MTRMVANISSKLKYAFTENDVEVDLFAPNM